MSSLGDYGKMAKPRAVEEWGDTYLIRPLGYLVVQLLRNTPLTPTMVSGLAVLAGWWTAWIYYLSNRGGGDTSLALLAALTFLLHSALDSADGQLARLRGQTSRLGSIIDGFCDNLAFLSIYIAIVAGTWVRMPQYGIIVTLLAFLAACSHSLQSSLAEYQRSLYLMAVHGKGDRFDAYSEKRGADSRSAGNIFVLFLQTIYAQYCRQQRALLPSTCRLERKIAAILDERPELAGDVAGIYERHQRPMLPGWALLASNSHKAGIILSAFVAVRSGSFWVGLGMGWYFIYDIGLNLVMAWLIHRQVPADRCTMAEISALTESP